MSKTKWRILYLSLFLLLFMTEVFIAVYIHDEFIRPYLGDILVVVVIYCFIRVFQPIRCRFLPIFIFLFSALVEFSQNFDLAELLGLTRNKFVRIILGSVFDWKDIACYAAGCILLGFYELLLYRHRLKEK